MQVQDVLLLVILMGRGRHVVSWVRVMARLVFVRLGIAMNLLVQVQDAIGMQDLLPVRGLLMLVKRRTPIWRLVCMVVCGVRVRMILVLILMLIRRWSQRTVVIFLQDVWITLDRLAVTILVVNLWGFVRMALLDFSVLLLVLLLANMAQVFQGVVLQISIVVMKMLLVMLQIPWKFVIVLVRLSIPRARGFVIVLMFARLWV